MVHLCRPCENIIIRQFSLMGCWTLYTLRIQVFNLTPWAEILSTCSTTDLWHERMTRDGLRAVKLLHVCRRWHLWEAWVTDSRCCNFANSVVVGAALVGGWLHFKFKFNLNTVCYTCLLDMQRKRKTDFFSDCFFTCNIFFLVWGSWNV